MIKGVVNQNMSKLEEYSERRSPSRLNSPVSYVCKSANTTTVKYVCIIIDLTMLKKVKDNWVGSLPTKFHENQDCSL